MRIKQGEYFRSNGEKYYFKCRSADHRFVIGTRKAFGSYLYTILDLKEGIKGPDDRIFGTSYDTDEDCAEVLRALNVGEIAISRRRSVTLDIKSIQIKETSHD